jgi:hypothetical protein
MKDAGSRGKVHHHPVTQVQPHHRATVAQRQGKARVVGPAAESPDCLGQQAEGPFGRGPVAENGVERGS